MSVARFHCYVVVSVYIENECDIQNVTIKSEISSASNNTTVTVYLSVGAGCLTELGKVQRALQTTNIIYIYSVVKLKGRGAVQSCLFFANLPFIRNRT